VNQIEPKPAVAEALQQTQQETRRVAHELRSMLAAGIPGKEIRATLCHPDCVLRDAKGQVFHGLPAIEANVERLEEQYKSLSRTFTDPIVGQTKIALFIHVEQQHRDTGEHSERYELAIFTVDDGKVVDEEFIAAPKP